MDRKIAQQHGKSLSQLKGIEKESVDSQMLNYWATIIQINNQHKLALIPKEKIMECKRFLEKSQSANYETKIYWFESFTFRSLRKLCFGNIENGTRSNTFYPEIAKELVYKYYTEDKYGNKRFIKGEFELKGDDQNRQTTDGTQRILTSTLNTYANACYHISVPSSNLWANRIVLSSEL